MAVAMTDLASIDEQSRRLFGMADMVLAVVFLSPEAGGPPHGLSPAEYYVGSRAAPLGEVPGELVAAVFGAIRPAAVVVATGAIWGKVSPADLLQSRLEMACTVLERSLGRQPDGIEEVLALLVPTAEAGRLEGHPLYAALRGVPWPETSLGRLWRACDLIREHRGDSHLNAWRAAGLSGEEINVLTELWRGKPIGSESRVVNGWTEQEVEAGLARLEQAGLAEDGQITELGRRMRDEIELSTSAQEREIVEFLGADAPRVEARLGPWVEQLRRDLPPPYWWHLQAQASPA